MDVAGIASGIASNKTFILVLFVAAGLLAAAYYIYVTYVTPKLDPEYVANKEFVQAGGAEYGTAQVILFTASWCPLSKKAMPVWNKIKDKYNGKTINNYLLDFKEIDGSDSESATVSQELDNYKVDGFPTIKMLKGNELVDFDANPTEESLERFMKSVLTEENAGDS
jgi:thiol-disulfide isomerase/thioredoxin